MISFKKKIITSSVYVQAKNYVLFLSLQGLLDVSDKYIYDQLISGKEDDSFYKG